MKYYIRGLKNSFNFSGRDSRKQYWIFSLTVFAIIVASLFLYANASPDAENAGIIFFIVVFIHLLPSLSAGIRRLHDTDKRGWWCLIWFIPYVGVIFQFILLCTKGTEGPNRFGPDPYCDDTSIWPLYTRQSAITYRAKLFKLQEVRHLEQLLETGAIGRRQFEQEKKSTLRFDAPHYTQMGLDPISNSATAPQTERTHGPDHG